MNAKSENNKRIARNTLLLYIRMFLMMLVTLYTSRIVLSNLGIKDYGIYNVVGGFVAMFSIISNSLATAISRFITYELAKGNLESLRRIFSSSVTIQLVLSLLIIVLAESIGIWFINHKLDIPSNRLISANWVFQFSIMTFIVNLISVPYNAAIIAHEKMSAFAYIGILEVLGKLIIAYGISISPIDKLIFYSILMFCISLIIRNVYSFYCTRHFTECKFAFRWDKRLLYQMFSFAGWNLLGSGSFILMTQGVNILINIFYGVTLNAARGIATQVDSAIQQFTNNFTTAINPQIIKTYANKDFEYLHKLICGGSKYSFFLMWIIAMPVLLETNTILHIWLLNPPKYASLFLKLTICISLLSTISNTLITSILATGNIKNYQIIIGGIGMCVFPIVFIGYKYGAKPEFAYYTQFTIFIFQLISRMILVEKAIKLTRSTFFKKVLFNNIKIVTTSIIIPITIIYTMEPSIPRLIITLISCITCSIVSIYFLGLSREEQEIVKINAVKLSHKIKNIKKL